MNPLDPTTQPRPARTLHERLAADVARIRGQVHGCVGDRPYRVSLVVRRWSGGEPGRGRQEDVFRHELRCGHDCHNRPTPPRVILSGQYSRIAAGVLEEGSAELSEIDPTYTESELVAYGRLQPGDEAYVEIVQDGRDGDAPDRPIRRYTIAGVPFRDTRSFSWVLRLKSQEPSAPFGSPTGATP